MSPGSLVTHEYSKEDIEANRFAMELLMPAPFVKVAYDKLEPMDEFDVPVVLAKHFKVPVALMSIKLYQMKLGIYATF